MTHRFAVDLPYDDDYDVGAALALLAAHAIPGSERVDVAARRYTRLLPTDAGPVAVTITFDHGSFRVDLDTDGATPDVDSIADDVRWWLDLDADLSAVTTLLGADPTIGPLLAARPGLRVVGEPDIVAAAVTTVIGQQVSVAAGRTFAARLVTAYGTPGPSGLLDLPRPATLARADVDDLRAAVGLTNARACTVVAVARAFADGLDVTRHTDPGEARRRLLEIPGVGPWTVDYLAVRALGDRDAFPAGDLVLRRALGVASTAEAVTAAAAWSPLRAYAAVHLWTATAYVPASGQSSLTAWGP